MRRVEQLELTLKPPRHGWLPFRLSLDDIVIEDAASNVLNDPLSSLFDLAQHVAGAPPMSGRSMTLRHEVSIESSRASRSLIRGLADLLRDAEVDALNSWRKGETVATYQDRLKALRALSR